MPGWRTSLRRRTGSGIALEALRDDALYKYTFSLLITYFTSLWTIALLEKDVGGQQQLRLRRHSGVIPDRWRLNS